jgi:hypothetical protein
VNFADGRIKGYPKGILPTTGQYVKFRPPDPVTKNSGVIGVASQKEIAVYLWIFVGVHLFILSLCNYLYHCFHPTHL